jgi:hypothetical protein
MQNESSKDIIYCSNIYTDGEKYFYTLYNETSNQYFFDAIGYKFNKETWEMENEV